MGPYPSQGNYVMNRVGGVIVFSSVSLAGDTFPSCSADSPTSTGTLTALVKLSGTSHKRVWARDWLVWADGEERVGGGFNRNVFYICLRNCQRINFR